MEEMEFERVGRQDREITDSTILHELLARLNDPDDERILSRPEVITVEDVAEALHLDPDFVAEELQAIYEEHRLARLSGVIRELEEPLYRVERPGHSILDQTDNPLYKLRSVQILSERNRGQDVLPRRKKKEEEDKVTKVVSYVILGSMTLLLILIVCRAIFAGS